MKQIHDTQQTTFFKGEPDLVDPAIKMAGAGYD
jgi:hypothetical protein